MHIYLFKLVTNQLEGFVNGISMSGDCDDTFRARSVANINFGTTLKEEIMYHFHFLYILIQSLMRLERKKKKREKANKVHYLFILHIIGIKTIHIKIKMVSKQVQNVSSFFSFF